MTTLSIRATNTDIWTYVIRVDDKLVAIGVPEPIAIQVLANTTDLPACQAGFHLKEARRVYKPDDESDVEA